MFNLVMQNSEEVTAYFSRYFSHVESEPMFLSSPHTEEENGVESNEAQEPGSRAWNDSVLPYSWYHKQAILNGKRMYENKIKEAEQMDLYDISPKKLSKLLTSIDLSILGKIVPSELVEYDGSTNIDCVNIMHIKSKNVALTNLVANELSTRGNYRYFFKLLKYLEKIRNYNSFHCVSRAFQMQRLDLKKLGTLSRYMKRSTTYFDMRQILDELTAQKDFLICPLDIYIRDVESFNRGGDNEVSSMRFCRLVEILIRLQNQKVEYGASNRHEHFLLYSFWRSLQYDAKSKNSDDGLYAGQFLLV